MPIAELREHLGHAYAECYDYCGYCWLEGEANAGEFQGGGYDNYIATTPNSITGSSMTPTHPTGHTSPMQSSIMTQEEVHASHEAALAPRDMLRTDRRYLAMDDMTRVMYDLGRGTEHPADGTMSPAVGNGGEYAPEPAYDNPFTLTGRIGGSMFPYPSPSREELFYHRYRMDILLSLRIARPVDMIIVTGI